jgi:hypothetical protein
MKLIAIVLTAAALLSLVPASARAQSNAGGAFLGALAGALIGGILSRHFDLASDRREQAELDSVRRTTEDETALKMLATSLEEFAVDPNGAYPATLNDLGPLYLNWNPGFRKAILRPAIALMAASTPRSTTCADRTARARPASSSSTRSRWG